MLLIILMVPVLEIQAAANTYKALTWRLGVPYKSETPWWVLKLISNWQNILHYRQSWSIGILYEIFCGFWRPLPSMVNTLTICFLSVYNNMLQMRSYRLFNLAHSKNLRRSWPMRSLYVELANLSYYTPSSIWPQATMIKLWSWELIRLPLIMIMQSAWPQISELHMPCKDSEICCRCIHVHVHQQPHA